MPTKSKILFLFILSLQVVCSQEIALSQNLDNTVQQGSVICSAEDITDNVYMRVYDLAALGYSEFEVSSVDFGIFNVTNDDANYTVEVIIYQANTFPGGNLTQITSLDVPVSDMDNGTLKNVPISASISDNFLVFAVSATRTGIIGNLNQLIIGTNSSGETAPGYYLSNSCGYDTPTVISTLFPPPELHLIMQVTGSPRLSLNEEQDVYVNISPNPTNDLISIKLLNSDSIESVLLYSLTGELLYEGSETIINLVDFSKGLYLLKIKTINGKSMVKKIVKQ